MKVADHIHGSSYLDYTAAFRHHIFNLDLHRNPFEDVLCSQHGLYFRTSGGEVEGLDALVTRIGHVVASASTWDCTDGIADVEPQVRC